MVCKSFCIHDVGVVMPTVTDDFLTSPLDYAHFRGGAQLDNPADPTSVNLDGLPGGTGQAITVQFVIPDAPTDSSDGLWDEITFTYTWGSANTALTAAYDGAAPRFHLSPGSSFTDFSSAYGARGDELVSDANATVGFVSGTATITWTDVAPGPYSMFVGELNVGDGEALYVRVDSGQALEEIPCFAGGTLIDTVEGPIGIERLAIGDMVLTANGPKPILWIGSRRFSSGLLDASPNLRPIRIKAGALGRDTPAGELIVSPQHRILVRSKIAQRMFGTEQVLVAAKQLLELDGVEIADDLADVEYFHLMFDQHEIILSNGAETESLYAGKQALLAVGEAARQEIFAIFPELQDYSVDVAPAALLVPGRQARQLARRHKKNMLPLNSA